MERFTDWEIAGGLANCAKGGLERIRNGGKVGMKRMIRLSKGLEGW